jgi:hypothetical protein
MMRAIAVVSLIAIALLAGYAAPPPPEADPDAGWVSLFDGQSLEGWKASENAASFTVADGAITCDGDRSHLFYVGPEATGFEDFELEVEVLAHRGANSGIYFHTAFQEEDWPGQGFEIQVNNSQERHGDYLENKKTASLYGYRNLYKAMGPDDEWFTIKARVEGKRVRTWVDGTLVVDYREPDKLPASWDEEYRRLGSGTFAFQCHDPESKVSYRNVRVRPIPEDDVDEGPSPAADETFMRMLALGKANFPLVDLHTHLKGGLTLDDALRLSRETGMFMGIALNIGQGQGADSDEGALEFLKQMEGQPVFVAAQAEGREWLDMFSPEVLAKFDYVFTDSMTFTDDRSGKRSRLWMPDEVEVGDPQAFMDMLVKKTVGILESEPVDIYVNPTFLPEVVAGDYDTLWTEARMKKVIDAAVKNEVAIEINGRYKLPSERFLRMAKEAGAKFSFGTNNGGADDLGDWSYPLEMQEKLELGWQDMFVPGHGPSKAQKELAAKRAAD